MLGGGQVWSGQDFFMKKVTFSTKQKKEFKCLELENGGCQISNFMLSTQIDFTSRKKIEQAFNFFSSFSKNIFFSKNCQMTSDQHMS